MSPVFSVSVGPDKIPFFVHESILRLSPVLGRMCASQLRESNQKHIDLPEDDDATFAYLLDYLYTGNFGPRHHQDPGGVNGNPFLDSSGERMKICASVYIMADKYQVESLKAKIGRKMDLLEGTPAEIFFNISKDLYSQIPDSDTVWRRYFREKACHHLMSTQPTSVSKIMGKVLSKDPMVLDLIQAQCQMTKDLLEDNQRILGDGKSDEW